VPILTNGAGQAVVDTNSNGTVDGSDGPVVIGAGVIDVLFPDGGDGLPEVTSLPGTLRGKLIVDLNPGLYRTPSSPVPLGAPVPYTLTAVSAATGLAVDGTASVSGALHATVADLTGRLIATPAIFALGAVPTLTARLTNHGAARDADLYLGILRPDASLFTLDRDLNWTAGVEAVLEGFEVSSDFNIAHVPLPPANLFTLPGDYSLYFAVIEPGTFDFISLTATNVRVP
jgi:hypothetical protein